MGMSWEWCVSRKPFTVMASPDHYQRGCLEPRMWFLVRSTVSLWICLDPNQCVAKNSRSLFLLTPEMACVPWQNFKASGTALSMPKNPRVGTTITATMPRWWRTEWDQLGLRSLSGICEILQISDHNYLAVVPALVNIWINSSSRMSRTLTDSRSYIHYRFVRPSLCELKSVLHNSSV